MNNAWINEISRKRLPQTMFCFVWDNGGVIFSLTPPQESAVYLRQTLYYAALESDWEQRRGDTRKPGHSSPASPFPSITSMGASLLSRIGRGTGTGSGLPTCSSSVGKWGGALNSSLPSSESICYQIKRRPPDSLLFSTLADLYAECKTDALCDTYLWWALLSQDLL